MTGIKYNISILLGLILLIFISAGSSAQNIQENGTFRDGYIGTPDCDPLDMDALSELYTQWTADGNYQTAINYASGWIAGYGDEADKVALLFNYAYIGQWNMASDNIEEARYWMAESYGLLKELSAESGNIYYRISFYRVHNTCGIYYVNVEMDYRKAISHFFTGFEAAEKYGDREQYTTLGCNLVVTYFLRNDPSGLPYALKIYEYGDMTGDKYIKFCGSYVTGIMYYVMEEYQTARQYMEEALLLMDKFYDEAGLYNMYANILLKCGEPDKAEIHYLKALKLADAGIASSISGTSTYLSYGEYLLENKKYAAAIDILNKGIDISKNTGNTAFRYKLYKNLSSAYRSIGDMDKALDYYIIFHEESDSIFNAERERSINELRVKYEAEKKEREIEQGQLKLVRQNRKLQAIVFVLIIIVILSGAIFLLYRHKNRLYIQLLRQHQETLTNERKLERKIEQMESAHETGGLSGQKKTVPALTDSKYEEIFARLEGLMGEKYVYREKDLTVEKVAKMIGTNRTYLSKAINEKTGLSFNYYINSYRIEEAVCILSDPDSDMPLKTLSHELGFHSLSTFYKLFNSVIGMPPSKFREKILAELNAA